MDRVTLVLDTCVLRDKNFIIWLGRNYNGKKILPPTVYMEFCRQEIGKNGNTDKVDGLLKKCDIEISRFEKSQAKVAAELMSGRTNVCIECGMIDWVDTLIAACIGNPPNILVTRNKKDFPSTLEDRVMTPEEVMAKFKRSGC